MPGMGANGEAWFRENRSGLEIIPAIAQESVLYLSRAPSDENSSNEHRSMDFDDLAYCGKVEGVRSEGTRTSWKFTQTARSVRSADRREEHVLDFIYDQTDRENPFLELDFYTTVHGESGGPKTVDHFKGRQVPLSHGAALEITEALKKHAVSGGCSSESPVSTFAST